jgi:hypothetical protein
MRVPLCTLVVALVIAGCGGGGTGTSGKPAPTGKSDPRAKAAAQAYLDAYTAKSVKRICELLAPTAKRQVADVKGSCSKTIRFSLHKNTFPKLTVAQATATGNTAAVTIRHSQRQLKLQRVGGTWKVLDGGT